MTIGDRIKNRRKYLGMSAEELGRRLGKDRSTIYRYEKGDIENLPLDVLEPIAAALGTTPQYLMGWEQKIKDNDAMADIIVRMRMDMEFFHTVEILQALDSTKLKSVQEMLKAFAK